MTYRSTTVPDPIDRPASGSDHSSLWLDGGHQSSWPGSQLLF